MARTIAVIQQQIIETKNADPTLSSYEWSDSKVAIWRLWTYVIAFCIWTLENLFDYHKIEVSDIISTQKPHTLQWYVHKAKLFQYGDSLPANSDIYATTSTDPAIVIVKYAAAVELANMVRIKVAKENAGTLESLSIAELAAFTGYMSRIKDAGVRLQLTSGDPDNLQLALSVYYDPLVLSSTGSRIDGASFTPVMDAINSFLADLPFNGVFVLNELIVALQAIDGVKIGYILSAQANYAATPYLPITIKYTPDAGYMALDETYFNANVTYTPYAAA
ncbi:MAG: hypothetical protein K9G49_03715 [Taibaiella sp.]|nr:hypothetical protein [Taibaiella sp.]